MTARLARQIAESTTSLVVRRASVLATTAVSMAVVARSLSTDDYGELQTAFAVWTIALSVCEFGFGPVLSREFATQPDRRPALLRMARNLQAVLGAAGAVGFAAVAIMLGIGTSGGLIYLAFAPGILCTAFNGGRSLFLSTFDTRNLVRIDIAVAAAQCVATVIVAATTNTPVLIALVTSVSVGANAALVGLAAHRKIGTAHPARSEYRTIVRQVVPVGFSSIVSRLYVSIDIVLLGAMSADAQVAHYAGAVKLVTFLNTLTGLVASAALPGLAALREDREAMVALAGRLTSWLCVTVVPCFVLSAVYAGPLCVTLLGPDFTQSTPLVVILLCAGTVAIVSQILGMVLTTIDVVRPMLYQNLAAVAVNITANVFLIPRYAATASAWITVLTEVIVCAGSALTLSGRFSLRPVLGVVVRPAIAIGIMAVVSVALRHHPWLGVPAGVIAFAVAARLLRCWPAELRPRRFVREPQETADVHSSLLVQSQRSDHQPRTPSSSL